MKPTSTLTGAFLFAILPSALALPQLCSVAGTGCSLVDQTVCDLNPGPGCEFKGTCNTGDDGGTCDITLRDQALTAPCGFSSVGGDFPEGGRFDSPCTVQGDECTYVWYDDAADTREVFCT